MKNQPTHSLLLMLQFLLVLSLGCQKAATPDVKVHLPTDDNKAVSNKFESVPTNLCSAEMLRLGVKFKESQSATTQVYSKMTVQKDLKLNAQYSELAKTQLERCQAIPKQMETEKIESCLKSKDEKTIENSIFKNTVESKCVTISNWEKDVVNQDAVAVGELNTVLRIQFSNSALKLIQSKESNEFHFLSRQQILAGREQFKYEAQAGFLVCTISTLTKSTNDSVTYKFIAETRGGASSTELDIKKESTILTFQDQKGSIISLTCFNMPVNSDNNRQANLSKIFGSHAKMDQISKGDPFLNADVAPSPKSDSKDDIKKQATADKEKALDQSIQKARETLDAIVDDTLAKTKAVTVEAVKESLVEARTAADDLMKTSIAEARTASDAIVSGAIAQAQRAAEEVSAKSIQQAQLAAEQVSAKSIQQAQLAAEQVSAKSIQQAQIAADAVVDKGINKAKVAAAETVTTTVNSFNPLHGITERVKSGWAGLKDFFGYGEDTVKK